MEYTITLPDTLEVSSRGQSVEFDLRELDPAMLAIAVQHGLTQKIADAAAGAAYSAALADLGNEKAKNKANVKEWTVDESNWAIIQKEAVRMMQVVADRLKEGDWGAVRTGGGGGVSPVVALARQMAAAIIKRGLVARDGNAKAYTGLTTAGKHELADRLIEQTPKLTTQAQEELDARKAATKAIDLGDLGL